MRRVLFVDYSSYLDQSDGAIAARALMETLAQAGYEADVLCGSVLDVGREVNPADWLAEQGWSVTTLGGDVWNFDVHGVRVSEPPHLSLSVKGVRVTMQVGATTLPHEPDPGETAQFLVLLDKVLARFRPGVVAASGIPALAREFLRRAKARGAATLWILRDFPFLDSTSTADIDALLVGSPFAAAYYHEVLGRECVELPDLVDPERIRTERAACDSVIIVEPTVENGAYVFAQIAEELGRRRPDIPLLAMAGPTTEAELTSCKLDLRNCGRVEVMPRPAEPRRYWERARICLLPSLGWEHQPRLAIEAMIQGIPVLGSDRPGVGEALGAGGWILPLPARLTPVTRVRPTAAEVEPWIQAIVRLWDEPTFYADRSRQAHDAARRWSPELLTGRYLEFFGHLGARPAGRVAPSPPGRGKAVILVPYLGAIDPGCDEGLRELEAAGVRVVRRSGSSQIDVARNTMASDALHDGFETLLFIDADVGFELVDALRILARPEPVVAGVYPKKGERALTSRFEPGIEEVLFGPTAPEPYPLRYAATGFLRIKAHVLRRMIAELGLPLCNARWGRGVWPFFMPLFVPDGDQGSHYLGEDWAFSHRLHQIGIVPLADTSIRLWHFGRHPFSWEDAGADPVRYRDYTFRLWNSP
jgi:hypothetical protein